MNVPDDGVMVQLSFSLNVGRLFDRISYFEERVYVLLDSIRQELALVSTTMLLWLLLSLLSLL